MIKKTEEAVALFQSGLNCSQTVLGLFCENYGMDRKQAYRMMCGFGGGARAGELCGAVSGAIAVIGLKYGQDDACDKAAKTQCYENLT